MPVRTITTILLILAFCLLLAALAVFVAQNIHLFANPIISPTSPQPTHQGHW